MELIDGLLMISIGLQPSKQCRSSSCVSGYEQAAAIMMVESGGLTIGRLAFTENNIHAIRGGEWALR